MSRNIPVNDDTYETFTNIKDAVGRLKNERITNDVFFEMLMKDFSMSKKANALIEKFTRAVEEVNNGHKKE